MKVFTCEDDFEAILSCIYDAWVESKKVGYANVQVIREKHVQPNLFDTYVNSVPSEEKAKKVVHAIETKISNTAYIWCYRAAMSDMSDAPDAIFRFLILGFRVGSRLTRMLTEDVVLRMMEINRRVGNESHFFREFARFTCVENVYICHLEPKSNVIQYVTTHFADRMPSENFIIIDDTRKLAGIHPKDEEPYYRNLTDEEFERFSSTETYEDSFTSMWQTFFDSIAIKQRINPACQRNHFPMWMRKHATEFQK